jgi:hypothetical protein
MKGHDQSVIESQLVAITANKAVAEQFMKKEK